VVNGQCAGDKYALVMKFVDHVFDDQVIDHMTLKIILPEGSTYVICRPSALAVELGLGLVIHVTQGMTVSENSRQ